MQKQAELQDRIRCTEQPLMPDDAIPELLWTCSHPIGYLLVSCCICWYNPGLPADTGTHWNYKMPSIPHDNSVGLAVPQDVCRTHLGSTACWRQVSLSNEQGSPANSTLASFLALCLVTLAPHTAISHKTLLLCFYASGVRETKRQRDSFLSWFSLFSPYLPLCHLHLCL